MAAYTDAAKIAAYLGLTLTAGQQTQAGVMADAATAWVERRTGRSWQAAAVADEAHEVIDGAVYLHRAVTAVASVKVRARTVDAIVTTLGTDAWELLDAASGVLLVVAESEVLALVSYTPASTVPADIQLAATMVASSWLQPSLAPQTEGIESASVGQSDAQVKFRAERGAVPAKALEILREYTRLAFA